MKRTLLTLVVLAVSAGTLLPGVAVAAADDQPPLKNPSRSLYGPFFLYNAATKLCADLPGTGAAADGAPVDQSACARTGEDNQQFVFEVHGTDGDGDQQYHIKNVDSGFCLDVTGRDAVPSGTPVQESACLDEDNEDFRVTPRFTAGGLQYYWLQNTVAGLMCLDVAGTADPTPGVALSLVPCLEHDDHEWALVTQAQLPPVAGAAVGGAAVGGAAVGGAAVGGAPTGRSYLSYLKVLVWGGSGFLVILVLGLLALLLVRRRQKLDEASRAQEAAGHRDSFWQPPVNGRPQSDEPTRF